LHTGTQGIAMCTYLVCNDSIMKREGKYSALVEGK